MRTTTLKDVLKFAHLMLCTMEIHQLTNVLKNVQIFHNFMLIIWLKNVFIFVQTKLTELLTLESAKYLSIVHLVILLILSLKDALQTVLQPKQHTPTMTHKNVKKSVLQIFLLIIQHMHVLLFVHKILLILDTKENVWLPALKTGMLTLLLGFVWSQQIVQTIHMEIQHPKNVLPFVPLTIMLIQEMIQKCVYKCAQKVGMLMI